MELADIKAHWARLGQQFGEDLKATTKTTTIKQLEIDALRRAIVHAGLPERKDVRVLEVGCGNGHNLLPLAEFFPAFTFVGLDYVPAMIDNARALKAQAPEKYARITFDVGDVLALGGHPALTQPFDFVFTDRCLINLNTPELQLQAMDQLMRLTAPGGHLAILENWVQSYGRQNDCREAVGLPRRVPDPYNVFLDEDRVLPHIEKTMTLVGVDDFGSLHDLTLYVMTPLLNDGRVDYQHPLVQAATDLSLVTSNQRQNPFGSVGQNRLFVFRRPE